MMNRIDPICRQCYDFGMKRLALHAASRGASVGYYTGNDTGHLYYGADYCIVVDHVAGDTTVTIKQIGNTGGTMSS
jgi:hypothetical protein